MHMNPSENQIVEKASEYVSGILNERLPRWALYHSHAHTLEVVESTREIAAGSRLNKSDTEVVLLAAWFHDTGYTELIDGHEERSASIAGEFLQHAGYPDERIEKVKGCIMATRLPQRPENLLEEIVCDADISHIGKKGFFRKSDLMRLEWEKHRGNTYTVVEWLNINVAFVAKHQFHTDYARSAFSKARLKNLGKLQKRLLEASELERQKSSDATAKQKKGEEKNRRPEQRGFETMFRTVPKNHLDLTSLADQKAHLMISNNSIILSVVVGLLLGKFDTNPYLIPPTLILVVVCLSAIVLAILATRPKITSGRFSKEDIQQKKVNLLFFGNFHNMTLSDFEGGMWEMMNDRDYLYGSMIKDVYFLGKVLGQKYKYLRWSYTIFMYGLVFAVLAYVVAFIAASPAT